MLSNRVLPRIAVLCARNKISYKQGQSSSVLKAKREYFYFIDHRGQLFLDDTKIKNFTTCFKDKKFLKFFFERLKLNDKDAYKDEFPFMSPCGVEMNFIKCEELPTVYNKIITFDQAKNFKPLEKQLKVSEPHYNGYLLYAGDQLWTPFEPSKLSVNPESGRVYHPCEKHLGGVALIASALATELSSHFHYPQNNTTEDEVFLQPISIDWNEKNIPIEQEFMTLVEKAEAIKSK